MLPSNLHMPSDETAILRYCSLSVVQSKTLYPEVEQNHPLKQRGNAYRYKEAKENIFGMMLSKRFQKQI